MKTLVLEDSPYYEISGEIQLSAGGRTDFFKGLRIRNRAEKLKAKES